ncbi:MAG: hypothetical protein ACOCRK_10415, partial [bacterium]
FRWYVHRVVEQEVIMGDQKILIEVHLYTGMAYEILEDGTEIHYRVENGKVMSQEIKKNNTRTSIIYRYDESKNTWIKRSTLFKDNKIESILPSETGKIP